MTRSTWRTRCDKISGALGTRMQVFALVALRYVDEARLSECLKGLARHSIPLQL